MRAHLTTALGDRDIYATMLFDLRALSAERQRNVIRRRRAYESMIEEGILAAQRGGELRTDVDARHLTLALLNLLNWTMFWFNPRGTYSVTQLGEVLVAIFLDGARIPAARKARVRPRSSQSRSRA
jgi:TetR/AcrR family transcriptional regulator, cholesterol catabolism regulator